MNEVESYGKRIEREERAGVLGDGIGVSRGNVGREDTNTVLPAKDMQRYSLLRAVNRIAKGQQLDGVEAEINSEMTRIAGKPARGSFYMPHKTRALNTTTGSGAVMTTTESDFIDVLRPKLLTQKIGATVMSDLHGIIRIPQKTATGTAYWLGDGGCSTGSTQTIGQVTMTPHTVAAMTDITRQFAEQSSFDAEKMVRDDLANDLAVAIDIAAFQGTGTGNQPLGLLNQPGLTFVGNGTNGGSPNNAMVVALETAVAVANADIGNLKYVTTPQVRGLLKVTPRSTSAVAVGFVWQDDDEVNNYPAVASTVMPYGLTKGTGTGLSSMVFGNFADLAIGMWGGLDILVDPYTGSSCGTIRIVALQDVDVEVRRIQSFAAMNDINTVVA